MVSKFKYLFYRNMKNITKQSCGCSKMKPCKNSINYNQGMKLKNKHILERKEELTSNMHRNISEGNQPGVHPTRWTNINIIVNPWSAVQVDSLLPSINLSSRPEINKTVGIESDVLKTQFEEVYKPDSEPIYNEIKSEYSKLFNSKENLLNTEVFNQEDVSEENKEKKRKIIYWQITAKEVVQFKPCTEKFIDRYKVKV